MWSTASKIQTIRLPVDTTGFNENITLGSSSLDFACKAFVYLSFGANAQTPADSKHKLLGVLALASKEAWPPTQNPSHGKLECLVLP